MGVQKGTQKLNQGKFQLDKRNLFHLWQTIKQWTGFLERLYGRAVRGWVALWVILLWEGVWMRDLLMSLPASIIQGSNGKQNVFSWVFKVYVTWPWHGHVMAFQNSYFIHPSRILKSRNEMLYTLSFTGRWQSSWNPCGSEPALQLCSLGSVWLRWVTELHRLRSGTQAVLGRKAPLSLPSHNAAKVQSKLTYGSFLTTWNSLDLNDTWVSNLN